MIIIQAPKWQGASSRRVVGLPAWKIIHEGPITTVRIMYKDKYGNRLYPNDLQMASDKIASYPTTDTEIPGSVIYLVPIDDFKVLV